MAGQGEQEPTIGAPAPAVSETLSPPGLATTFGSPPPGGPGATATPPGVSAAAPAVSEIPVPGPASEPDLDTQTVKELLSMMKDMMKNYENKIADIRKQLDQSKGKQYTKEEKEDDTLKPIHVKDLKLPEEYDGAAVNFMEWHSRFKTMLENRNAQWQPLIKTIEEHGDKRIKSTGEVKEEMKEKGMSPIADQIDKYANQMFIYLSSYTKGIIHTRVLKGKEDEVFDIYRDIVNKGKNINAHRIIQLKGAILRPKKAARLEDMDKILTDWKFEQKLVTEFDGSEMSEENKKTILMSIMPGEHVEYMRGKFMEDKFKDDYFAFEQELYDRMAQRKMDEDNKKGIHAVTGGTSPDAPAEEDKEYIEVWSEEWQCYIHGLAAKRGREDSEEDAPEKKQKVEPPG